MFTKQSNRGDAIIADVLGSVLTSPRALKTPNTINLLNIYFKVFV